MPPETCPNCDAPVPSDARSCPECGADDATGWNTDATLQRLGLPEDPDDFDYEDFVRTEFSPPARHRLHPLWWITAVVLLLALLLWLL